MDEAELQRRWSATLGGDPSEPRFDPTTTFRPPAEPASGGGSGQHAWPPELTLLSTGDDPASSSSDDPQATTLHTPPPSPAPSTGPSHEPAAPTAATRFELGDVIGRGGMGLVFEAIQTSLQRVVAVKKLLPGRAAAGHEARFVAEAMVAGLLDHPNVVPVHDLGRTGRGELLLAMKLARGPSWKRLLKPETDAERARAASMDLRAHLDVLLGVCNAIAYAHTKGVAHLDLKPENVLVGEFGEVLVMDWGLAVSLDPALERPGLPHASSVRAPCGTPAYMPPELAQGDGSRIGPWTDVYLLGATLYEVLTGAPPHRGRSVSETVLAAARGQLPDLPPEVPTELRAILLRALQPSPDERYSTVAELRAALSEHLRHGESLRIGDAARRSLDAALEERSSTTVTDHPARYARFTEAVAGFRQACVLWDANEAARLGELEARHALAALALDLGDLGLAGDQAAQLRSVVRGREEEDALDQLERRVRAETSARAAALRHARRARVALAAAIATIVVGGLTGVTLLDAARRRALVEEGRARAQEALARQHEEAARAARREAERRLADSLLAEGRTLGETGEWDRARARLQEARALLATSGRPTLPVDVALARAWHEAPEATLSLTIGESAPLAVAMADEADVLVVGGDDGRLRLLSRRGDTAPVELAAHQGGVLAAAVSPDGRRAVTGGHDGLVKVWDVRSGRELATLAGHDGPVRALALARHGDVAVSGGDDRTLRAWDLASASPLTTIEHEAPVLAVAASWDGTYAASAAGRAVRVVHVKAASTIEAHTVHTATVTALTLDHGQVVSGDEVGAVVARDLRTSASVELQRHAGAVRTVSIEADGAHVLSIGEEGLLRRSRLLDGGDAGRRTLSSSLSAAALTLDLSARAVTAHRDGSVRVHAIGPDDAGQATVDLPGGREATLLAGALARAVAVDPTGRLVVVGDETGVARVWDAETGRLLHDLAGHSAAIVALDVVSGGVPRALTVGADGALVMWDLARGLPLRRVVTPLALRCGRLVDDATAVLGDERGGLHVVDLTAGTARPLLEGAHAGPVAALAVAGGRVVCGGDDGAVVVASCNLDSAEPPARLGSARTPVRAVALAADGSRIVAGRADGELEAWEPSTRRRLWSVRAHRGAIEGLVVVDHGRLALSAGADGAWAIWDLSQGAELGRVPEPDGPRSIHATADGLHVVVGTGCGARSWDVGRVAHRERLRPAAAPRPVDGAALGDWCAFVGALDDAALLLPRDDPAADAARFRAQARRGQLVDAADAAARLVAARPDDPIAAARLEAIRRDERQGGGLCGREPDIVRRAEFTPDGARLLTTSRVGTLTVWDARAGVAVRRLRHGPRDVFALAVLDDRHAVTGGADHELRVWDLTSGATVAVLRGHTDDVTCVVAGGGALVSGSTDRTLRVWDLSTLVLGRPQALPPEPRRVIELDEPIRELALLHDGRAAVAGRSAAVAIVDLATGERVTTLEGAPGALDALVSLPDGSLLAASGRQLLRASRGADRFSALGRVEDASIYGLACSPDGRRALTGDGEGAVRLWDLTRGIELDQLTLPALPLTVAWSPSGKVAALGLRDGQVRVLLADR